MIVELMLHLLGAWCICLCVFDYYAISSRVLRILAIALSDFIEVQTSVKESFS